MAMCERSLKAPHTEFCDCDCYFIPLKKIAIFFNGENRPQNEKQTLYPEANFT